MNDKMKELIKSGKLIQGVIFDSEGMVVEAIGHQYNPEILSSLFFSFQSFIRDIRKSLKVGRAEEVILRAEEKQFRVVLRYFIVNGNGFYLISLVPINSHYHQTTNKIIRFFSEKLKNILGDDIQLIPFDEVEGEVERDLDISHSSLEEDMIIPVKTEGIKAELRELLGKITEEIRSADLVIGEKSYPEISEETVNFLGHKFLRRLSSNVVEKIVQKTILQIAENLIKKEILKAKKEIDSILSS